MSGGRFNYNQHIIREIADDIQEVLDNQGKEKSKEDSYFNGEYPEHYTTYSKEVESQFKEGIKFLRIAAIYTQRIDWLLSGDDGEENFLKRLKEDLKKLEYDSK
jgi:hypothetical protein